MALPMNPSAQPQPSASSTALPPFSPTIDLNSYESALCIIPPSNICSRIDKLRCNYDKAYRKWPPHINILYPFVGPSHLERAEEIIGSVINKLETTGINKSFSITLQNVGRFLNRQTSVVYLGPEDDTQELHNTTTLQHLQQILQNAFVPSSASKSDSKIYIPHLTVGQATPNDSMIEHTEAKANLLLPMTWEVGELAILIREHAKSNEEHTTQMKLWKTINLTDNPKPTMDLSKLFLYDQDSNPNRLCYWYDEERQLWKPISKTLLDHYESLNVSDIGIATYNVLAEFTCPPSRARYPALLQAILSAEADCDVLSLQEVTDDFLSHLLNDENVRQKWPFVSHGPPRQLECGPLPSLCNIVVLSRFPFTWELVPFARKHKSAVVVKIESIQCRTTANQADASSTTSLPLIIASVHLTPGLNVVAAKESQIQTVLSHLHQHYSQNTWILLGDFNITTSSATINTALESKFITADTAQSLKSLESLLAEQNLNDAWYTSRPLNNINHQNVVNHDHALYGGEEGATFDPLTNKLASKARERNGMSWNNRPQRYDRILYKNDGFLAIDDFSFFGNSPSVDSNNESLVDADYGSDHWGVNATFSLNVAGSAESRTGRTNLGLSKAPFSLQSISELESFLKQNGQIPSQEDNERREKALEALNVALTGGSTRNSGEMTSSISERNFAPFEVRLILVTVGSYRLGVWNSASDVDCLCIGAISSKTFFALAKKRLKRAAQQGIKVIRTVKALSGTMMILKVHDVMMDVHYCPAAKVTETWPKILNASSSDTMFDLPILSLRKLKPFRDDYYILQTVPDLGSFRMAHRLIKLWATNRGIYAAKFGYLGGIHITVLLVNICKKLHEYAGSATPADIIRTFFQYYAHFDWTKDSVFDPFFHNGIPRYQRTAREPMVILTPHRPISNIARATTPQSVRTISTEIQRAESILSEHNPTWAKLVGFESTAAQKGKLDFLSHYPSYVRVDVSYWGSSKSKAGSLLAWIESRCVLLLVELSQKLPEIHARIWPKRFSSNRDANDGDLHACYLVGLEKLEHSAGIKAQNADRKLQQSNLLTCLYKFADQLRGNDAFFDSATSYIAVSHVPRSAVRELEIDIADWAVGELYDDPSDSEDEDEEDNDNDSEDDVDDGENKATQPTGYEAILEKEKEDSSGVLLEEGSRSKLRPAGDVLNRLRWDSSLESDDFVIGYEDRFVGVKEIAFGLWKSDQTEEEFIPQHRIVYFKRISDGVKVWDRRGRVDLLFGVRVPR